MIPSYPKGDFPVKNAGLSHTHRYLDSSRYSDWENTTCPRVLTQIFLPWDLNTDFIIQKSGFFSLRFIRIFWVKSLNSKPVARHNANSRQPGRQFGIPINGSGVSAGVNQPSWGSEHHEFLSPPGILRQTIKIFSTEPRWSRETKEKHGDATVSCPVLWSYLMWSDPVCQRPTI